MANSDLAALAEQHRFVADEDDVAEMQQTWEGRMALKYSEMLYKEYAVIDLSRWREGKYGLRWRTEAEVREGKGHRICGNVTKSRKCSSSSSLGSFELNYKYTERGVGKNELVKVRLCAECATKIGSRGRDDSQRVRRLEESENEDEEDAGCTKGGSAHADRRAKKQRKQERKRQKEKRKAKKKEETPAPKKRRIEERSAVVSSQEWPVADSSMRGAETAKSGVKAGEKGAPKVHPKGGDAKLNC
jgi:protein FRA10AC1